MLRKLFRRLRRPLNPAIPAEPKPQGYVCKVNWTDISAAVSRMSHDDPDFNASTRAIAAADAQMVTEVEEAVSPDVVTRSHLGLHPTAVKAMVYFALARRATLGVLPPLPKEVMWDFAVQVSQLATMIAMAAEIHESEE